MPDPAENDRLQEILEQVKLPSPDLFIWTSILGLIGAGAVLIVGYLSSTRIFILLAIVALVLATLSMLEDRIWSMIARCRFVRDARRAGLSAESARLFWDNLDDE